MNTATILFVDDDKDFLQAQKAWFGAKGYEVWTAESGEDALALLEENRPDIIFLDLMIEHFDTGFVLGHKIHQTPHLRGVPVVMLSGVAGATGQRFDQDPAGLKHWSKLDAFLDKPVTSRQLLGVVEKALGRSTSTSPSS